MQNDGDLGNLVLDWAPAEFFGFGTSLTDQS
jgi:hypothetical protein